ncbi:MAG: hypothetical protein KUL81_06500 [Azonexus sp.]|jgi:hypothetical protein|nr:hypothetical protein [Azonexus sp.]MDX9736722.1 tellurite-like stress resistance cysteine protease StiP [Azonexus sp.]
MKASTENLTFGMGDSRDRGIDANALDTILARGARPDSIVFIDGWTGKGVITAELTKAVAEYNRDRGTCISPDIYVLSDLFTHPRYP